MNKISDRQLYFFLACIAPVGKLVILPARLAEYCGNDLLFPALIQYLLQAVAVFCVLLLAKRGASLFELLSATFGKWIARVLMFILAAFLFYASLLPLLEQKIFVQGSFYDTIPSVLAFTPFFLLSAYLCSKPLSSFGRTWDILGPLSIAGFLGIFVLSVTNADYGALLPVGSSGVGGIARATAYTCSWFFDSTLLLFLIGKFEYKKHMALKGALCYLAGGLAILFFLATFYGIFEGLSFNQLFAFTEASKYFSASTVLGRVDFIFIYALALVMIFYCALPLQAGNEGILQAVGRKKYLPTLLAIGINLVLLSMMYIFDFRFVAVMKAISQKGFWVFPVFSLLLPPLCLLLRRPRHENS